MAKSYRQVADYLVFLASCPVDNNGGWLCRTSGIATGGRGTLLTGKFLLTYQEKRSKEKRENQEEKKENKKREG